MGWGAWALAGAPLLVMGAAAAAGHQIPAETNQWIGVSAGATFLYAFIKHGIHAAHNGRLRARRDSLLEDIQDGERRLKEHETGRRGGVQWTVAPGMVGEDGVGLNALGSF